MVFLEHIMSYVLLNADSINDRGEDDSDDYYLRAEERRFIRHGPMSI